MTRLTDNISSRYIEARNALTPKTAKRKIVAYVESYDDVWFWRSVLQGFESADRVFEIMLPTRSDKLERGKKAAIIAMMSAGAGSNMIALVDADYDYLIGGRTPASNMVVNSPYVFHTYAYAIDNLMCYAPSLRPLLVAATLNDRLVFDFPDFLRRYSETIFPLFVWNVMMYRTPDYARFSITDFLHVIEVGTVALNAVDNTINRLRRKVNQKINQLQREIPKMKNTYLATRDEILRLGVTPDTTYLYIQGHHLFDKVVLPIMKRLTALLVREREQQISDQSLHRTQRTNELACYSNSIADIELMMKRNVGYITSEPYRRTVADIARFLDTEKPGN